MASVVFSPASELDLDEIWLNVALESPSAADRLVDAIGSRAAQLATFPELGPARPDIAEGMRVLTQAAYLVLYRVTDKQVEIVRVIHGARDLSELF